MATRRHSLSACLLGLLIVAGIAGAADLYRYQDESGNWVFTDRKPEGNQDFEQTTRAPTRRDAPMVRFRREDSQDGSQIIATNDCPCPMQAVVWFTAAENLTIDTEQNPVTAVLSAGEERRLVDLRPERADADWSYEFKSGFLPGEPGARHEPEQPYRLPFAAATGYLVSQAFPDAVTHVTPDSRYAIDFSMPVGDGVFAARGGLVFEVAYTNFQGGIDNPGLVRRANLVRIMHDDGTFAVYAHLAWDSIRVRPGQRVTRGERIAASGNTGFSSGPHLHFAVMRNTGGQIESLPVRFSDGRGGSLTAKTGERISNP